MVRGPPQSNSTVPPASTALTAATASCRACSVQLSGVPSPTVWTSPLGSSGSSRPSQALLGSTSG